MGVAAAGLALLVGGGLGGTLADLAAVGPGVSWALGIVLTKRLHSATDTDPLAFTAWQTLVGALGASLVALALPGKAPERTPTLILALAYNAVLVYGLVWFLWFLWFLLLQRIDAGIASLGTLAVPVVGVLAGVAFLGERPAASEWLGMGLTLAALMITASVAARGGR